MVSGQNCNRACPEMLHRPSFCINTFGPKMLAQIPSCCTDETIFGVVSSKTLNVRLLSPGLSSLRSDRAAKDSRHKPYRPRSEPDHHSLKHNPGGMINMSAVAAAAAATPAIDLPSEERGCPIFFFRHYTSNYSTSALPTGGGYLTPFPPPDAMRKYIQ